jgi:aspartate aminotransferase
MQALAERIANLQESATIAMSVRTRELRAQGRDIVDLTLGEPDFATPQPIGEAAKRAIDEGYTRYTPVPGYLDVREAICRKFKRDNGLHFGPSQIVISTGAKQSIANVVFCLCNPGDEVILPAPYWVSYTAMVHLAEGVPVVVHTGIANNFKISAQQLEQAITPRTRLLIFSSPCNPSGSVYSRQELEEIAEVLRRHPRVFTISDEIYEHINFSGEHASLGTLEGMEDRVATVNGLSKGYAMTGWRLGYMGAPAEVAAACTRFQGQFTSATCSIAQRAILAALEGDQQPTRTMRDAFLQRRDLLGKLLAELPGWKTNTPMGAFYHFPDVSAWFDLNWKGERIGNAERLAMLLLEEAGVGLVAGTAFGSPECLRISYAAAEDRLLEAMDRIRHFAGQLNA